MKTIDLTKGRHSLSEVLTLAKAETVLLRTASGEDFLLEQADEFDREAAELGESERFSTFLAARSGEVGDIPIADVRRRRRL